jgi:hypothetical protein
MRVRAYSPAPASWDRYTRWVSRRWAIRASLTSTTGQPATTIQPVDPQLSPPIETWLACVSQ